MRGIILFRFLIWMFFLSILTFYSQAQSGNLNTDKKLLLITKVDSSIIAGLYFDTVDNSIRALTTEGTIKIPFDSIYSVIFKKKEKPGVFYLMSGILSFMGGTAFYQMDPDWKENRYGVILQMAGLLSCYSYAAAEPEEVDFIFYLNPKDRKITKREIQAKISDYLITRPEGNRFSIFMNSGFQFSTFTDRFSKRFAYRSNLVSSHKLNILRNLGISIPFYNGFEAGISYLNLDEPDWQLYNFKVNSNIHITTEFRSSAIHLTLLHKFKLFDDKLQMLTGLGIGQRKIKYKLFAESKTWQPQSAAPSEVITVTDDINDKYFSAGLDLNILFKVSRVLRMGLHLDYLLLPKIVTQPINMVNYPGSSIDCGSGSFGFNFGLNL